MDNSSLNRFIVNYKAGDLIFCEYEIGSTCYMVREGSVRLLRITGEIETTVATIRSGDFFGEMALLDNLPRTATAVALEDVVMLEFSRDNFNMITVGNPAICIKLLSVFARRIHRQKRQYSTLLLNDKPSEVMDVLLMMSDDLGLSNELNPTIPTTAYIIATTAGLPVNSVRHTLNSLQEQGRLTVLPQQVIITNQQEMERMVSARRKLVLSKEDLGA
jgi:CRP/FNR family cyclic AMP-dependent transcriptional regulator